MTKNKLVVVRVLPGLRIKVVAERCERLEMWFATCYVDDEPYEHRPTDDVFATVQQMIMQVVVEHEEALMASEETPKLNVATVLTALAAAMAAPGLMLATHLASILDASATLVI